MRQASMFPFAGDPGELFETTGGTANVRWAQQALNRIGHLRLATDGVAGVQTRSAIRSFQRRHGLPADGVLGPATRAALIQAGAPPPPGSSSKATPPTGGRRAVDATPLRQGSPPVRSRDPHVAAAMKRKDLATGVPGASTFHDLVERHRPRDIPALAFLALSTLEASGWNDATHGTAGNQWTKPTFYELGVFQTPAGLHGTCSSGAYRDCQFAPPGHDPRATSPWFKIAHDLGLDPMRWTDPTTQVRIGIENLVRDAATVRKRFPDLFPDPGSRWGVGGALYMAFGPGIGYTLDLYKKHHAPLAARPEAERWAYVQRVSARAGNPSDKLKLADKLAVALRVPPLAPGAAGELGPLFR